MEIITSPYSGHEADSPALDVEFTVWNLEARLSLLKYGKKILNTLEVQRMQQLRPEDGRAGRFGVTFLPEAYDPNDLDGMVFVDTAQERLKRLGLAVMRIDQEMPGSGRYPRGIMMLVDERLEPKLEAVELATRYAIKASMTYPPTGKAITAVGAHMPDKNKKERKPEVAKVLTLFPRDPVTGTFLTPGALLEDMNNMRPDTPKARLLQVGYPFTYLLPTRYPTTRSIEKQGWPQRFSMVRRVSRMAFGDAYQECLQAGLVDTDPNDTPTAFQDLGPFGEIGFRIDQILTSAGDFETISNTVFKDTMPGEDGQPVELSDHRRLVSVQRPLFAA